MTDNQDQETLMKISNYAKAIKSVGLRKLMNDLIDAGILEKGYKYDTFKTNYRRLKEKQTGLFLKPIILNSIWPFLDSFSYVDLFGGNEPKDKKAEIELLNTIVNQQKEIKKYIASKNEDKPEETTKREYIRKAKFFGSAKTICEAIYRCIKKREFHPKAFMELFARFTFEDKETWKHNESENLRRIDKLIRYLLSNYISWDKNGNVDWVEDRIIFNKNEIEIGNLYLVIAYQIFIIERLLKFLSKGITLKTESTRKEMDIAKKGTNATGEVTNSVIDNVRVIRETSIKTRYEGGVDLKNFINCIKEFNDIFDLLLGKDNSVSFWDYTFEQKYNIYSEGLYNIIIGLNLILYYFLFPEEPDNQKKSTRFSDKFGLDVPDQFDMLFKKQTFEKLIILSLNENHLIFLKNIISLFKNLQIAGDKCNNIKNEVVSSESIFNEAINVISELSNPFAPQDKEEIDSNNERQLVKPKLTTDEMIARVMSESPFISGSPRFVDHTIDDLIS
jgi:hypothetical protein